MEEHVHKWKYGTAGWGDEYFRCVDKGCQAVLSLDEAETRLIEYETLRELEKACIRLYVGEITKPAWREFVRRSPEGQRLIALANILEGK